MRPAAALADRLGLPIGTSDVVEQALVHTSWLHEHPEAVTGHNERLEFLGDAVVNLAISEALFAANPNDDEGMLSARRAAIVSTVGLARLAHRIDLGSVILLGEGEAQRGGRRRPSILASGFEALAGALYLDIGYDATKTWLSGLAAPEIAMTAAASTLKSPKSRLQEFTQRRTGSRPEYHVVASTGPDHEKQFQVEVLVDGRPLGVGAGSSRRIAETAAAQRAMDTLRSETHPSADASDRMATHVDDMPAPDTDDTGGVAGTAVMDPAVTRQPAGRRPRTDARRP